MHIYWFIFNINLMILYYIYIIVQKTTLYLTNSFKIDIIFWERHLLHQGKSYDTLVFQ